MENNEINIFKSLDFASQQVITSELLKINVLTLFVKDKLIPLKCKLLLISNLIPSFRDEECNKIKECNKKNKRIIDRMGNVDLFLWEDDDNIDIQTH